MADMVFIGAGKMADAIVSGIIGSEAFAASRIVMSDIDARRLSEMEKKYGIRTAPDNTAAASGARCVLFAVKPQDMGQALYDVSRAQNSRDTLYVSIAAGVKISSISAVLGEGRRIFRVMPNLPVFAGEGASVACGEGEDEDFEIIGKVFGSVGIVEFVPEEQIDAFTALSGSGPAFVAAFAESFITAGEKSGIAPKTVRRFVVQTLFGAAKMMASGGISPQMLREMVSSPGGTTVAGLEALEKSGFQKAVETALKAAEKRSKELSAALETGRKK